MSKLNKKYYNLLNKIKNKEILIKEIPRHDSIVLLESGYLRSENYNFLSSKALLELDEFHTQVMESYKSTIIIVLTSISLIISIVSLFLSIK